MAANYIQGFGTHIDKVRVNSLVGNMFESGKFDTVEKIAKAA